MKSGKIPQRIKLYCRPEKQVSYHRWADVGFEDTLAEEVKATPTFVVDATNPKTCASAEYWARNAPKVWCTITNKYVDSAPKDIEVIERDNTPVDSVRIVGLDIRGNGGRAYQALVDEKYLVDMREDVILDSMLHVGIGANGIMHGSYIFAQINSEMKIIRVGSKLHELMVQSTDFSARKAITSLVPGHVYSSKTKTVLYIGEVWHTPITATSRNYYEIASLTAGTPVKKHIFIRLESKFDINSDLETLLGSESSWWVTSMEMSLTIGKSFKVDHGAVQNYSIDEAIKSIQSRIEPTLTSHPNNHYIERYCDAINISTVKGYIHPEVRNLKAKLR